MKYSNIALAILALTGSAIFALPEAQAQMVDQKARQKSTWYSHPRELQIIDERPTIRDFREAPATPQMIQLPPGPGAGGGNGSSSGGGGYPGGGTVLPAGGMPIGGGGDPGYRTPVDPMGALPKSGFGSQTNIPARGMAPKGLLPSGVTTGIHGNVMPFAKSAPSSGMGAGGRSAARPVAAAPKAASYGGNYAAVPSSGSGYGSTSTSTAVSGRLLHRLKGN